MLTLQELKNLENGLYFNKKKLLGKGFGGSVYIINNKYVVKNLSSSFGIKYFDEKIFNTELEATVILSFFDVAPKVIYHSKPKEKFRYFVMERLTYTLADMLKYKLMTQSHLIKLTKLLVKLNNTNYRHNDLHFNNIMWSNYYDDFRVIDWGEYYIKKKKVQN
jgi:tRNA A-37 threonylcarbamoyl transferase component Bud32